MTKMSKEKIIKAIEKNRKDRIRITGINKFVGWEKQVLRRLGHLGKSEIKFIKKGRR